ncbi:hypothetical protein NM688_g167 [Phlebia brevispora]|uniref:Uncharacterized protein n=1 Tax=Phlebia brevispora TaxID=194682 RepID=A0ACC1TFC0_9APHY|nr:hypothetical protein NM688_g167 [Phlebia brevispora]
MLFLDMLQPPSSIFSRRVGEPTHDHYSCLRVFALLGHAYIPAAFTLALGVAPFALGFYQGSQVTSYYIDDPVLGSSCYFNYLISPSVLFDGKNCSEHIMMVLTHLTVALAATLSSIAADVIAIVITWIKIYRHVREASSTGADVSFGAVLLRYGSMFFIVFFILNLTDGLAVLVILFLITLKWHCSSRLPNIILSRFLINLRRINVPESGSAARFSRFSLPNFRMPSIPSIIGNLGEPLADNEDDHDEEDHAVAEAYEERVGAAVGAGEDVGGSDVMNIGTLEIEENTDGHIRAILLLESASFTIDWRILQIATYVIIITHETESRKIYYVMKWKTSYVLSSTVLTSSTSALLTHGGAHECIISNLVDIRGTQSSPGSLGRDVAHDDKAGNVSGSGMLMRLRKFASCRIQAAPPCFIGLRRSTTICPSLSPHRSRHHDPSPIAQYVTEVATAACEVDDHLPCLQPVHGDSVARRIEPSWH